MDQRPGDDREDAASGTSGQLRWESVVAFVGIGSTQVRPADAGSEPILGRAPSQPESHLPPPREHGNVLLRSSDQGLGRVEVCNGYCEGEQRRYARDGLEVCVMYLPVGSTRARNETD